MKLPPPHTIVSIHQIKQICIYYGRTMLLKRIEKDYSKLSPFKSDG